MNKKITLFLYYVGLLTGIFIMNYILKHHLEFADSIVRGVEELDKIRSVKGQELFFYLFFKRIKQLSLVLLVYFHISKVLSLFALDLYYACIKGMYLSLCMYYYGMVSMVAMSFIQIPHSLCFSFLEIAGWKYLKTEKHESKIGVTNIILFILFVTIIMSIVEISVNLVVAPIILNYI